jgi:hypothetical protein
LDHLGYNGQDYSEHSSRRDVATHSSDIGVEESAIQNAGHWLDSRTVKKYIDRHPREHQKLTRRILDISI